jgi:hypothetical protein
LHIQRLAWITAVIIISLMTMFTACQKVPKTTIITAPPPSQSTTAEKPVILSFKADPAEIATGQPSTLNWQVSGAVRVEINQGVGTVAQNGSVRVNPTDRTLYTITAANSAGSVSSTIEITVTKNLYAKPIALFDEEMMNQGFIFDQNSEPTMKNAISTYYVRYLLGRGSTLMIDNMIYVFNTVQEAETVFAEEKSYNKIYVAGYLLVGTQSYYLENKGYPPEPNSYSLRFQKNNVYVKMLTNLSLAELEKFARIVESRIK